MIVVSNFICCVKFVFFSEFISDKRVLDVCEEDVQWTEEQTGLDVPTQGQNTAWGYFDAQSGGLPFQNILNDSHRDYQ